MVITPTSGTKIRKSCLVVFALYRTTTLTAHFTGSPTNFRSLLATVPLVWMSVLNTRRIGFPKIESLNNKKLFIIGFRNKRALQSQMYRFNHGVRFVVFNRLALDEITKYERCPLFKQIATDVLCKRFVQFINWPSLGCVTKAHLVNLFFD